MLNLMPNFLRTSSWRIADHVPNIIEEYLLEQQCCIVLYYSSKIACAMFSTSVSNPGSLVYVDFEV